MLDAVWRLLRRERTISLPDLAFGASASWDLLGECGLQPTLFVGTTTWAGQRLADGCPSCVC